MYIYLGVCYHMSYVYDIMLYVSRAPKGNGIGATGSKNWVWF